MAARDDLTPAAARAREPEEKCWEMRPHLALDAKRPLMALRWGEV